MQIVTAQVLDWYLQNSCSVRKTHFYLLKPLPVRFLLLQLKDSKWELPGSTFLKFSLGNIADLGTKPVTSIGEFFIGYLHSQHLFYPLLATDLHFTRGTLLIHCIQFSQDCQLMCFALLGTKDSYQFPPVL